MKKNAVFQEGKEWDRRLNIHTSGRDASSEDENRFPYEPTPYSVLERLSESGLIQPDSHVMDYGSGKGRIAFFLKHKIGCRVTGVEFNPLFVQTAEENLRTFAENPDGITFIPENAEDCVVPDDADVSYFFNPFSEKILLSVIGRITESLYRQPRNMKLLFYYPSDEYVSALMMCEELQFEDEIDCSDLFPGKDRRERILIFSTVR